MEFNGVVFEKHGIRIILDYIGEGHHGDYDASDKNDEPLIRVDVKELNRGGNWELINQKCSVCLNLSIYTPQEKLKRIAERLFTEISEGRQFGVYLPSIVGRWTWINWKNRA